MPGRDALIIALDVPDRADLLRLGRSLAPHCGLLKVGLEAFVGFGPDLVRELGASGAQLFLDLKLHDIPRTVGAAVAQARQLDVQLLTVHAAGGADMVRAAVDAAEGKLKVLAVTVLTSLDAPALRSLGLQSPAEVARTWAELALGAGAAGVVCSAHELDTLRELPGLRVVPGVRPVGSAAGDQKRVATPRAAVRAGASHIVVGRPILDAADPVAAARAIVAEVQA